MDWFWVLALVGLIALNAVASFKILANPTMDVSRRFMQVALIWLVPVIGSVVCLAFLATDTVPDKPGLDRTAFVQNADIGGDPWDAPPGANICGCSDPVDVGGGGGAGD